MMATILYRSGRETMDSEELAAATAHFKCTTSRMQIANELVIGRYSVLPFYEELDHDLRLQGSRLINSLRQHRYLADISAWYLDLEGLTPDTWFHESHLPPGTSFVVKGATNSRKFEWDKLMFAPNKAAALKISWELGKDALIGSQAIVYRRFEKFHTYYWDIFTGLPVTEEYRFFVCNKKVLCGAFYWSNFLEDIEERCKETPNVDEVPQEFLHEVIERVGTSATFYVIDVARKENGDWCVVELNDGQMSGLSCNNPAVLYKNLAEAVQGNPDTLKK